LGATIISGIMGDTADAITIIIIVIVNAILGFVQEFRTEKSLEALKNLAAPTCKVFRDGGLKVINSAYLTIGDVVVLEAGDRIPADGEFLEGSSIMVDESLLTGESVGVSKDTNKKEKRSGYMGTTMLKGKGLFTVTSIGMDTEMGKIANLLDNIKEEKSPLKERLESLGKILVVLCLVICAVVTILGIIRGNDITEMFLLGVSLAVAAIPEGLAAIVTVSLALGVSRMLKRNALVRKLPAVETLGCTSVICSDKTGTLTQNKMTVKEVYLNGKICELDKEKLTDYTMLMKSLVLCNDCNYDFNVKNIDKALHGDPTETALVKLFFKDTNLLKAFVEKSERVYDIPFDSTRKMMSVIMRENGKECCYVKGAPERVIEKCSYILENNKIKPLTYQKKKQVASFIEAMSSRALRCIAGAYKDENLTRSEKLEDGLIFIGVAGSIDPPRAEARDAVLRCKLAGIKPVMITGDHKNTALAIAKSLNICNNDDQVVTGEDIESMTDDELKKKVEKIRVFARVSPDHKLRIVRAFKRNNNVVAMTG
ncbi:MAG: HAD-IC family P-type ATPase, partial [Clostridium sp.]|nr:HAD-IC family P-type ATPase [Clostridium sp.]